MPKFIQTKQLQGVRGTQNLKQIEQLRLNNLINTWNRQNVGPEK